MIPIDWTISKACGFLFLLLQYSRCKAANSVSVYEGTDALLPCPYYHPDPDPPPSVIEWLRQGQQLPVYIKIGKYSPQVDPVFQGRIKVKSNGADLMIRRVEASDEGWYECRVIFLGNDKEKQRKNTILDAHAPFANGTWVKLIVTAPPAFKYTSPSTVIASEGEVLLLRCRSVGRPVPIITWHKDGRSIKNGQDGIRLSDGELAVTSLNKSHKGKYICRAQNVEGQIEHSTSVYIQGAPVFTSPPKNSTIKEGQDVMFGCRAEGYPANIKYSWFFNDVPVALSDEIRGRFRAQGVGELIIYNVVADDSGTVSCRASNEIGQAPIASATLTVQFPARVNKMPSILYAGLGLKTSLPCPAVAVPQISTVTWRKGDQVVKMDQNDRFSLGSNGSLVIEGVQQRDAARYTCTPYNILGTLGESTGSRLIVRYPPYFTKPPKSEYEAEIGKGLEIPCQGSGDPPPHVSWMKLNENGKKKDLEDLGGRLSFENGNLTIDSVVKSDHGLWQCVLSNAVATIKHDVKIFVKYTTPHAVTNISVTTSRHSARISWVAGYNGGYSQHFMIWYKRADMGDHSWQTQSVESFRKVVTVSNLESDTIYQFAILAENVLGSGQFSQTVAAKTKEIPPPTPSTKPESVPAPSQLESYIKEDSGLLLLMWQPPLEADEEDLLGYMLEFRKALEVEEHHSDEFLGDEYFFNLPFESNKKDDKINRSKRFTGFWNNIILSRIKRDALPVTNSPTQDSKEKWTRWNTLAPVNCNETTYLVPTGNLFRDQVYEFQVLTVSKSAYSAPSASITISTKGLTAYPIFVSPASHPPLSSGVNSAVLAGIAAALLFIVIVVIMMSLWCHLRKRRKEALDSSVFTFGRLPDEKSDRRSRSKWESPSHKSVESKSSSKIREENTGPFAKLKRKMWKADVEIGQAHCSTEELVELGRKISATNQQESDPAKTSQNEQTLIRQISRASDGKFHISDQSNDSLVDVDESDLLMPQKNMSSSRSSQSQSQEWDPHSPLLTRQTPDNASESLEIDCSQSDIEVRYIKEGRDKGRFQSTSMSSIASPKQYNLSRRQSGPYASILDSSAANYSYQITPGYEKPMTSRLRQSITSPVPEVSQYAQHVRIRPNDPNARRNVNLQYRVSSPPRFSEYNPTPASPSKYRYHKHTEQPGGHYHVSPRDSITAPAERLVYDPKCTRIEPIYEVGPYHPANLPNRHSSFVIDTRRELPHHPHPHRTIQIYRNRIPIKDSANYPKPVWHNRSAPAYHTLPHQPQALVSARNSSVSIDSDIMSTSLMRHKANYSRDDDIRGPSSASNTNSLGRSRSKSCEKEVVSPRRRVCSVDDLTRDSPLPANLINVSEQTGSVDFLSLPRPQFSSNSFVSPSPDHSDRTRIGCSRNDDHSDVISTSSSPNSDKVPRSAVTSRHLDLREKRQPNQHNEEDFTKVVISSPLTSPREDDSSAVSSLSHQSDGLHRPLEVRSSGYDSHTTSHACDSPAPSLPTCSSPNITIRTSSHDHDRTSTASSSDRSRKDTSSVDEKYEWDSEFAMESEILDALRHFGTHNKTGSVSQALVDEIQKLGMDTSQETGKGELENLGKDIAGSESSVTQNTDQLAAVDTSDMYTKESMERRCAALKKEYQRYQLEQIASTQRSLTSPKKDPTLFTSS